MSNKDKPIDWYNINSEGFSNAVTVISIIILSLFIAYVMWISGLPELAIISVSGGLVCVLIVINVQKNSGKPREWPIPPPQMCIKCGNPARKGWVLCWECATDHSNSEVHNLA